MASLVASILVKGGRALRHAGAQIVTRIIPAMTAPLGYLRSNRQVVSVWPDGPIALGTDVVLFCHYDRRSAVRPYVERYIASLGQEGLSVVLVSNCGWLPPETLARLKQFCRAIVIRRNVGYDFGAWADVLRLLELPRADTSRVILANDSVYAPIASLAAVCGRVNELGDADVIGATDSWQTRYHMQSYFLVASRNVLTSEAWSRFWRRVRPLPSKYSIIHRYEIGLSQHLLRAGFRCVPLWPYAALQARAATQPTAASGGLSSVDPMARGRRRQLRRVRDAAARRAPLNPTSDYWRQLIELGYPFLKCELLRSNPGRVADIADWLDVLASRPGTDPATIIEDLKLSLRNKSI